ncbi:MAG TPA: gamma-glutamyltransferase [Polyangiaceae bacterium]|nr:gamma-glutamyltransferase [Polyangiaceae bacterium]
MNASRALSSLAALSALGLVMGAFPAGCGAPPPVMTPDQVRTSGAPSATAAPTGAASASGEPRAGDPRAPKSHRHAVASENPIATKIAMSILERGGSAVDAAVAGALAGGVVQPVSSGIGGGGFAMIYDAKAKRVTVLDFHDAAPRGLAPNDYVGLSTRLRVGKEGIMTGVPGEVAGLTEMHARWGKLAFAECVRGAAEAAAQGFPVSAHMARVLKMNEKWVQRSPGYAPIFHPAGALLSVGATAKNPALAATLQRIAAEGKAAFYEGAIAADILATARAGGSRMVKDDLARYEVIERAPLRTAWEGNEVFTTPPPSAGGVLMLETLHMHAKADLEALGFGTGAYQHLLAETFRGAVADRMRLLGDPAFVRVDVGALTSRERMKARRARISLTATTPAEKFPVSEAGTSHLVTVDAEGNVVSLTTTVSNMFGAKLVTKGGFVLNDALSDFTLDRTERIFGIRLGPNRPRGGARPISSMTPTIVVRGDTPILALGGSGGTRVATGTTQVLLAHLAFGRRVGEAVADGRLETPPSGGLYVDTSTPPEIIKDLERRGEVVSATMPNFSAVQAISIQMKDGARVIEAAADPRKGGEGAVQ